MDRWRMVVSLIIGGIYIYIQYIYIYIYISPTVDSNMDIMEI